MQMEKWDGIALDINATCANLGDGVCSQLLGAHAITGCDTVSYPFGKSEASVLKTLKAGDFPGLFDMLGEEGATEEDLMAVGRQFFASLYGQSAGTSMTRARSNLSTRKQGKPLPIMSLPPTNQNLSMCDTLTCRCCCGERQTNRDLQMSPSLSMVENLRMG